MGLTLRGYTQENREFEVFWRGQRVGTYRPGDLIGGQKRLVPAAGFVPYAEFADVWEKATGARVQ